MKGMLCARKHLTSVRKYVIPSKNLGIKVMERYKGNIFGFEICTLKRFWGVINFVRMFCGCKINFR